MGIVPFAQEVNPHELREHEQRARKDGLETVLDYDITRDVTLLRINDRAKGKAWLFYTEGRY